MSCFLAMLMVCGASGRACRSVDAPGQTIGAVVWQIGIGAIRDQEDERDVNEIFRSLMSLRFFSSLGISVATDGRLAGSLQDYFRAAIRVAGYVADLWAHGSVELWRGDRHYTIRDGLVKVSVNRTIFERVGRRSIPIRITVTITAVETPAGTRFSGAALGTKRGYLGGRLISRGLNDALGEIETIGRRMYRDGASDPGDLAERVIARFGR